MYEVTTFRRDVETFGRQGARGLLGYPGGGSADGGTSRSTPWRGTRSPARFATRTGARRTSAAASSAPSATRRERFAEDRLRVLRALRFAGRFGLQHRARHLGRRAGLRGRAGGPLRGAGPGGAPQGARAGGVPLRLRSRLYARLGGPRAALPGAAGVRGSASTKGRVDVWEHLLRTRRCSRRGPAWCCALAALLHDVGKPSPTRRAEGDRRFPGHAGAGAALAAGAAAPAKALERGDRPGDAPRRAARRPPPAEAPAAGAAALGAAGGAGAPARPLPAPLRRRPGARRRGALPGRRSLSSAASGASSPDAPAAGSRRPRRSGVRSCAPSGIPAGPALRRDPARAARARSPTIPRSTSGSGSSSWCARGSAEARRRSGRDARWRKGRSRASPGRARGGADDAVPGRDPLSL